MRLTFIFVAVLAASVSLTSLAAWGITYGVSSARVTTMASEFTQLGLDLLQLFDSFVSGLLKGNSELVNDILALERQSGDARMQQTKAQVLRIIGALLNYTNNTTGQSQTQMNAMVDTFSGLMGTVFGDFQGVTVACASDLRAELAGKVSTYLNNFVTSRTNVIERFQSLQSHGLVNLSRAYADPITADDCLLLGLVCDSALEFGAYGSMYMTTAGGRLFYCLPAATAFITQLVVNGSQYTEYRQTWQPDGSYNYQRQCLTKKPVPVALSQGCSLPQDCQCGADQRCLPWYAPYRNGSQHLTTSSVRISDVYYGGLYNLLQVTISYPILDTSSTTPTLLAASATDFPFIGMQNVLGTVTVPAGTFLATLLNDTYLTLTASNGRKCAANETAPGNLSLPLWSSLRSCDPYLREVATWLAQNRTNITAQTTVKLSGVVWDIFPSFQLALVYFTVVGAKDEDTYRLIDASAARAASQLTTVRAEQLGRVAASGAATQKYMAVVQAENIQEVQAMQDVFATQMEELENTSRSELAASQQSSTVEVAHLMDSQTRQVDALKAKHLDAMAVAAGWILGVVFGILLGVLLCGSWGTVQITRSLNNIIGLMEDVADMKVENLEVCQRSQVKEVARIETAFQVLVVRLAEYKSYMPASLFQKVSNEPQDDAAPSPPPLAPAASYSRAQSYKGDGSESGTSGTDGGFRRSSSNATAPGVLPTTSSTHCSSVKCVSSKSSDPGVARSPTRKPWGRHVTVLAVNVTRFREVMPTMNDGAVRSAFNHYVSNIHEVVTKERGNVDCILGDQVFVTFNAHIPCPDPAAPAATAALNLQSQLLSQTKFRMGFQMGISCGQAYAGAVGYSKFKTMVTMGDPMRIAASLSHIADFDNGAVIADSRLEERIRYDFILRPVEVVRFPQLAAGTSKMPSNGNRVFLLQKKRNLKEDEWMYQLDSSPESVWGRTFSRLEKAQTLPEMQAALLEYLAAYPQDHIAVRLRGRLPLWLPAVGISL